MATLSRAPRRPSSSLRLRLLFYCKLDVKNDALINLADNLKTKGLSAPRARHLSSTPLVPLSWIKIQDAKLPINEGCGWLQRRRRRQGGGEPIRNVPRRVITLKNYPSSEFHRFASTRTPWHRVSPLFRFFLISFACGNSQELIKRKNETAK